MSEIFDLAGKITPVTATMKLDLHTLVKRGLDCDDVLPDELSPIWVFHFEMMREMMLHWLSNYEKVFKQ